MSTSFAIIGVVKERAEKKDDATRSACQDGGQREEDAMSNYTIDKACKETGIEFWFDEDAHLAGFYGATAATIVAGTDEEEVDSIEWGNLDILNLWFARLGEERLVYAGAEKNEVCLDPYATELTMPVSPADLYDFVEDVRRLADDPENPPALLDDNGDERFFDLIGECDEDELREVLDDIEEFIDRNLDAELTYSSNHEEYCEDDEW